MAPSLTRGWVCKLLLLLGYAEAAPLGSEAKLAKTIFHWLQFLRLSQPGGEGPCIYIPSQETGWPSYTPGYYVPFSSPCTTLGATVEVFQPASTRRVSN
jgi:hypothetical protein